MLKHKHIFMLIAAAMAFIALMIVLGVDASHRDNSRAERIVQQACGSEAHQRFDAAFQGEPSGLRYDEAKKWAVRCASGPNVVR